MRKLLHPSYGILIIELLSFLAITDVILVVSSTLSLQRNIPYNVSCGVFALCYLLYLLYVLIDFALRFLKPCGTLKELLSKYIHDKYFRRICNSYVGSLVNFAMSIFYVVFAYVTGTQFYSLATHFFLIAFIGRIYLLYNAFNSKHEKRMRGHFIASILTVVLGLGMLAITTVCILRHFTVTKDKILLLAIALYTFVKFISAIVSLTSSRREHNIQLLSYCLLSISLAFYSMFMLVITMPVVYAETETIEDFTFFGYIFAATIILIGIGNLILHHRVKTGKITSVDYIETSLEDQEQSLSK